MQPPPLLPERSLRRVLAVSRANAWSVAGFGALCAVIAVIRLDAAGAGWTLAVIAAGAWELLGTRRLRAGSPGGLSHMIGAQFLLLAVIWAYAWLRWDHFNADIFWAELPAFSQNQITSQLQAAGLDPEIERPALLQMMNLLVCVILASVTLVYQGGLAIYYAWQGGRIRQALLASPPPQT